MTQNPYQQGPPPGYVYPGGQPDPQYQPQGYPPQQYQQPGPPPQQYQQQAPAGPPPGQDGFGMPDTRPAAGDQPAIHQLAMSNRLVLIKAKRWNVGGKKFNSDELEEQMVVDIIVCDGPPILGSVDYITKVETPFAAGPKQPPFFMGEVIVNKAIKDRMRAALEDPTTPNVNLGRLSSNPPKQGKGYPWWNLEEPTEADKAVARPIFAAWEQIEAAAKIAPQGPPPGAYQGQFSQPPGQPNYQQAPPGYGQPQYPQGPPPQGYPGYQAQNPQGAPPAQTPWPQNGQPPYPTH